VLLASGETIDVRRPYLEKNTVGYGMAQDPVDWFVGSEGTLGVVVAAELALLVRPVREIGLAIPFAGEAQALAFILAARESAIVRPRCLEYFDREALGIARTYAKDPGWAADSGAMVYGEESAGDDSLSLDGWLALAEAFGARDADVRAYDGAGALREARRLRHAVPAAMHERVAPFLSAGGRRVSTDWAVPYRRVAEALAIARRCADEAGILQAVTYGHVGNGHPHQNFVARNADDVRAIEAVVERTLRAVLAMGGTVAAEHGIGKLKRRWLPLQMTPLQIGAMRSLKRELDPHGILAPGNVFAAADG